jgi:glycosyltransferase involved in cell wall biosynthesis
MFSLHIDTARTWRGGQGQVLHTVMGLRELRHRTALVAHPDGELYRRMSEGTDLVPLAPRNEIDLAAAWRMSRVLKQLRRKSFTHTTPRGGDGSHRTLDRLSVAGATARRVAAHRVPHRRQFVFAVEVRASGLLHRDQRGGSSAAHRGRHQAREDDRCPRGRRRRTHRASAGGQRAGTFFMPTHAPVVGNIGALVPQKGQHHLVDAAAIVVRRIPDARFVILGEGELRPALEEQIKRKHLERHVFLAGFRHDALELLKGFDLFALSSLHEGMCTSLVDAMAASKAAVATAVGGVPEVLDDGETGFLVPPRDHDALADRIIYLLKNEAMRARMGEAALRRARERFTVERMVAGTAAVYETLIRLAIEAATWGVRTGEPAVPGSMSSRFRWRVLCFRFRVPVCSRSNSPFQFGSSALSGTANRNPNTEVEPIENRNPEPEPTTGTRN